MRRRYVMGVAATGYSKLVVTIVQLAIIPVLAVHWGLALYGQWLMIVTLPQFLAASDFGFSTAASTRVIGEVARGDTDDALVTFQTAFRMILQLTAAMAAVVAIVSVLLPDRMLAATGGMSGADARVVMLVMMAYGLITMQEVLFAGVSRAEGRQARWLSIRATTMLVEGGAVLLLVVLGEGPLAAAIAYLAVRTLGVLAQVLLAAHSAQWLKIGFAVASRERLRELLRPAIAAMVLPLSLAMYLQGTALAIGLAAGPATVPLYTSLRTASRLGLQLTNTLIIPLMPEITAAHARGDNGLLARLGGLLLTANAIAGPIFGASIALFGGWLLAIWTRGVIQPPETMIVLVGIGLVLGVLWNAAAAMLLAINRHESYSYIFVAAAFADVALTYVLVAQLGVTGAAVAGMLLDAFMFAVVLGSLRRNIGRLEFSRASMLSVLPKRWRARFAR
jgi:O-antigen/teichoic acid export membrane protein